VRPALVALHRWFGLAAAAFLFVAGATGAIIAWDHEVDAWLNPGLFEARAPGPALPALELARRVEAADTRVRVSYMPLATEPGEAFGVYVEPRIDAASGKPYEVDYNQVAVDPASGAVQGRRMWGRASLARLDLLPFLYRLHYSLHLPAVGGYDTGVLLMGGIAVAWVLDTLVALWISFPSAAAWRRSFAFRWGAGGHKLVFDLHRSGGAWLFLLVLMIAVTSVSMNLERQVMRPVVAMFSPLAPSPFDERDGAAPVPAGASISPAQAIALAQAEAARRGIHAPPGGLLSSSATGLYGVGFFEPGRDHGDGSLGNPWVYVDARTGAIAQAVVPGEGSAGDVFMQAMFPLHSGRLFGLPGRVLMSFMGVAVAAISVTGVLIWARKRRGRTLARAAATVVRGRTVAARVEG
jgi:uncharacterized iron-regulated membrane protein